MHFSRLSPVCVVCALFAGALACYAQSQVLYVDFGANGNQSSGPDGNGHFWNNLTDGNPGGPLSNLVSDTGAGTGISLATVGFSGSANTAGTTVPDPFALGALAVSSATSDTFYVGGSDVLTVTLSNVPVGGLFRLSLFGSRDNPETRITRYDVTGVATESQKLTTSGSGIGISPQPDANRSAIAVFQNVRAAADGTITISVRRDTGTFGYLGVLRLETLNGVNYPPSATDARICGAPRVGGKLNGTYIYSDLEGDTEGDTRFVWQRAVNPAVGTPVTVASTSSYVLQDADLGTYFRMGVLPVATEGTIEGPVQYSGWLGPVSSAASISTFHIGSSFTRWGNMPMQLQNLAAASGFQVVTGFQLSDGRDSSYHWNSGFGGNYSSGTPSRPEIATGTWDAVILQPYNSEWQPSSFSQFQDYAKRFYDLADAKGSQFYLYDYWPWFSQSIDTQNDINNAFQQVRTFISQGAKNLH